MKTTRRDFIKAAAAGSLVATGTETILAARTAQQEPAKVSPNDRIRLATIGIGGQGSGDTTVALRVPGVELVAAADVYDGRLIRAKEVFGDHLFTTRDYREVLARPDVDAVLIATPDHWHARQSIDALEAGKHVYCEKPMVHSIEEGRRVIEAARKSGKVFIVGSQRVSSVVYEKARQLLAEGAIGELNLIEAWWNRNSPLGAWQYSLPPDASPENIDWDRFLGNAPKRPFEPVRLFRWRNYRDYGTGVAGDLFVHLFSGMHLIAQTNGPTRVMTTGGLRYWKDGRDVPDVMLGIYDYPKSGAQPEFNLFLKVNFADGAGENAGFRFVGSEGVITLSGGVTVTRRQKPAEPGYTIGAFPKQVQDAFLKEYRAKYPENRRRIAETTEHTYSAPRDYSDTFDHFSNFFEACRTGKPVIEDATFGFRAAGPALLSNTSYFEGRAVKWDPEAMKVVGE
ncbi:MAG TPA: Gfo/Idh/MocA family oxidoreductase [Blastocatellia bacterium]